MSKPFIVQLVLFLAACASQPGSQRESVASDAPVEHAGNADGLTQESVSASGPVVPDSSLYVGEVNIFAETGELYTSVYYHDHLEVDGLFESIAKQADSLVYEDVERRRSRLPAAVANQYFNLAGLDTIQVYKEGQLAGMAELIRVEHFNDVIESQFVAVFKPIGSSSLPDQLDYCTSGGKHQYKTIHATDEEVEDEQLTKGLLKSFVPDSVRVWDVLHMRIMPYHSVYSAINMQSRLLLIETNKGHSHILTDLNEDWFISVITALHLESNGKPVLLLTMGVNETDMIWTSLAVFDGAEYVFPDNNRLKEF